MVITVIDCVLEIELSLVLRLLAIDHQERFNYTASFSAAGMPELFVTLSTVFHVRIVNAVYFASLAYAFCNFCEFMCW